MPVMAGVDPVTCRREPRRRCGDPRLIVPRDEPALKGPFWRSEYLLVRQASLQQSASRPFEAIQQPPSRSAGITGSGSVSWSPASRPPRTSTSRKD